MMAVRIRPVREDGLTDDVRQAFADAAARGAPNPTLLRILARHPAALRAFYAGWQEMFYGGIVEHPLKELMRVRMARLRTCGY
jgi:alkylhydroperoxidase family enzyme